MRAIDIRRTFLDFFRDRGHRIFPSASLVPDDPTLLLTVAGMVPFKDYFTGERRMDPPRAASIQKCARTVDIENVGITARHQTLFEMLGNFSFGDYFKREAIEWAWELSLDGYGMEPDRIWVSVYLKDDESARIWRDVIGLPEERIVRLGSPDNFWFIEGATAPGGPNTELYYDRSPTPMKEFHDGDELMEYYNLVFTEFVVGPDGEPVAELPQKNVDTGGGLERTAQLLQGVATAYDTDLFKPILDRAQELTRRTYGADPAADVSLRILAEHARSAMFLVGDGVLPSNEGRGYVLRRLIRRAVRHAKILGVDDPVMRGLVDASIDVMGDAYPETAQQRAFIEQAVASEEEHFRGTLNRGLTILDVAVKDSKGSLSGDVAFKLHDTYGFPFELTLEIAQEAGLEVDRESFERLMEEQRDRGRSARKVGETTGTGLREVRQETGPSLFNGYERHESEATVVAIVRDGDRVPAAGEGDIVEIVLDSTPFYPEGGGQIGDAGVIEVDGSSIEILDTQRVLGDLIVHSGRVAHGEVRTGSAASARVDRDRRDATMRSHTATHILHALLRGALGDHARQAGSLVEPGRLRFDFTHFERVPHDILDEVEVVVNRHLLHDDGVRAYETTMDEARNRGAIMLFEEKYGDIVRVVEVGDYSVELCGGTHVERTSQIGAVKILGEASIGSNLRRIEALTGAEALADFRRSRAVLDHIATLLKTSPDDAPAKVQRLLDDLQKAERREKQRQAEGTLGLVDELAAKSSPSGDVHVVVERASELNVGDLQKLAAGVRDKIEKLQGPAVVVLGSVSNGRPALVAVTSTAYGVAPQALLDGPAQTIGARPGGKGSLATAVGSNADALDEALRIVRGRIIGA